MNRELRFYEKPDGKCQVRDYLRSRSKAVRGKAGWLLERLESEGDTLERPISDYAEDGIHELRVIVERQQHRILYFFHGKTVVATNAFLKKRDRIPKCELEKAKKARADWLAREEENEK